MTANPPPSDRTALGGVVGVGIDLCDVGRLRAALERQERLAERLFTHHELRSAGDDLATAQRFAAKEAVMKALGAGIDRVAFTDIEVSEDLSGVVLKGRARERARYLGAVRFSLVTGVADGPLGPVATAEVVASSTVS